MQMKSKKHLKALIRKSQRILPKKMFDKLYDITFRSYKNFIQLFYLMKGVVLYSYLDPEKWRMVKKVYGVFPYTLVGTGGLEVTYKMAKQLNHRGIQGDFIELGVARGGCAALMGSAIFDSDEPKCVERKLWLFDSYEGLPAPTFDDLDLSRGEGTGEHVQFLSKGSCLGTLDEVKRLMFEVRNFPEDKVIFVKGWFQDTVPANCNKVSKIALLRIDADWYESTKCCLEGLYDSVVSGGVVIVDDYQSCYGCQKAVDEFIRNKNLSVNIIFDGRGGGYFLKP